MKFPLRKALGTLRLRQEDNEGTAEGWGTGRKDEERKTHSGEDSLPAVW